MKHLQTLHTHLQHHHKKYLFGIFWSFALIKTILLFVGLFWLINVINIFAIGTATNVSITGTLLVGQTVTGSYVYVDVPWQPLGNRSFSSSWEANYISLVLDWTGTPYVAYQDSAYALKATVMRFNGANREAVGSPGFSERQADAIDFALDWSGTPYVSYRDYAHTYKATVMRFNGSGWENVGSPGFSSGDVSETSLVLDGTGTPYVAYTEASGTIRQTTVKRFNGSNWENIGTPGFSSGGATNIISLALDWSGTPYIAYQDNTYSQKATVMKFNGTSRETVGSPWFSSGDANDISFALDWSGTPYIAYNDIENSYKATVMKFNGTGREPVGTPGFSSGAIEYTSLFVYNGIPYIAYSDYSDIGQATVMKFNGVNWESVGSPKFSYDAAHYPSLFVFSGTPYIAFTDYYSGNGKATVMKYRPDVEGLSIYQWYRNNATITGATGLTHTLVAADAGTILKFEVTPLSLGWVTWTSTSATITIPVPIASAVTIIGMPNINNILTGSYTYTDVTSLDPEGISTYQWYRNNVAIIGATGLIYVVTTGDANATLKFEVTPISVLKTQWVTKQSNWIVINSFPLVTDVMLTGILNIGETLTGSYTYSDRDINWEVVGTPRFSSGGANFASLFLYSGTPYVAYSDSYNTGKATVMKFNGTSRESVGTPWFSSGQATNTSLFVYSGTPYVAYEDNSTKPFGLTTVMKFNGTGREPVGTPRFSSGQTSYTSLFVYSGTPYVAYDDIANSRKATVMKFNGTNREPVGSPWFSDGWVNYTSLFIYSWTLYVAYSDFFGSGSKATVMKFNGTGREPVGSPRFSRGQANNTSLFVYSGTLYVAYQDWSEAGKATVMKFNGVSRESVGIPEFSYGAARYTSLFIDNGTPYIAYSDYSDIGKVTVMKFNGIDWDIIGSPRFSRGQSDYTSLFVYNGTPYVAYNDFSRAGEITVMKTALSDFEGTSTYQWYRNHVAITGATGLTYTLITGDEGTTITFEVTPVALLWSSPGIAVQSAESIMHGPSHATCGNSIIETPETCDEWGLNGQAGHCNSSCNGTVAQPGGWGWVAIFSKDICTPERDCSSSYYDHICGPCASTGKVHNAANSCTAYSDELNDAYLFAYDNGITTIKSCLSAGLNGSIIRTDLAKMVSQFAIKVLKMKPDTKKTSCTFSDMNNESKEMKFYATIACQLGLMGLDTDWITPKTTFDPNGIVDRAQFGTILSRILRGTKYAGELPFYVKHLNALKKEAIMNDITHPFVSEMRGRVMLMLQRSAEKK
jgi:hypothetical protein